MDFSQISVFYFKKASCPLSMEKSWMPIVKIFQQFNSELSYMKHSQKSVSRIYKQWKSDFLRIFHVWQARMKVLR